MNEQAARILISLVGRYGPALAYDPLRCEGLLRDTCPRCSREIFVLVNAVRQNVPADLLAPRHTLPPALFRGFLVKRLQDELAFSDEAARWAVETWIEALGLDDESGRQDPAIASDTFREVAAGDLPGKKAVFTVTPEQRASWVRDLESGNMEARFAAIRQMAVSGDGETLRLLITAFENPAWRVRKASFEALAGIGEPAVPYLVEALGDSHEQVVVASVLVLGMVRAPGAVEPLAALLESGGVPVTYAIWALGEIGDRRAITPLTRCLSSSDPRIRSEAEVALRKFG